MRNSLAADLCGITAYDQRWTYATRVDTRDMSAAPNDVEATSVIVLGHQMDADLTQTYPSALAGAATGREYSHEASIVMQVAAYIRNLGYEATASMNDTGLVIPYALQAGLGEYARNQLVIAPGIRPAPTLFQDLHDHSIAARYAKKVWRCGGLQYLHPLRRRLSGQGAAV